MTRNFHQNKTAISIVSILAGSLAGIATADTFVVDSFDDFNNGSCQGGCTLREAVILTTGTKGSDTILLEEGIYTLSLPGNNDDSALAGDLDINLGEVIIQGAGMGITIIDAQQIDRLFHVGPWSAASLVLRDLTIRNGNNAYFGTCGGIVVSPTGTLLMERVEVTNCRAQDAGAGLAIYGEAILNDCLLTANVITLSNGNGGALYVNNQFGDWPGNLTVNRSLIQGNTAPNGGSACFAEHGGHAEFNNCTIRGNVPTSALLGSFGTIDLNHCTVTQNSYGTTVVNGSSITFKNSYYGGNTIIQNIGPVNSAGYNIFNGITQLTGDTTGNQYNVNAMLGPIADNGGHTMTMALLPGSPAIGAADPNDYLTTDQRGVARPQDGDSNGSFLPDIGAYEATPPPPGDLDGNGVVNTTDMLNLLDDWGPCKGCPEDLDGDGIVGVLDLLMLLGNWT